MSKKGLFEMVADAISRGRWARKDLENLDNRAFKMQGNAKAWAKNADKMNAKASALQAKAAYNEYLADKLRSDALDRVNRENVAWNRELDDIWDKQRMFNAVNEVNYFGAGNLYNRNGERIYHFHANSLDDAKRAAEGLGYDKIPSMEHTLTDAETAETAFEDMARDYYPMDGQDIQKLNISNSDAMNYLDGDYTPSREYWRDANNSINQFVKDNRRGTYYNNFEPKHKWKALFDLQQAPARYRK